MRMSPFTIEIVLHYHCCTEEHRACRDNVPIWPETIAFLLAEGLLAKRSERGEFGSSYETTAKGEAYVDALCVTPFPVHKWVMP